MAEKKFLLIKDASHDFWENTHHTLEMLLVAELTGRIPIIHWATNCLYEGVICNNAFELYFSPVSPFTVYDAMNEMFTYYPPIWKCDMLNAVDPERKSRLYRNIGDFIGSRADVVVGDTSFYVTRIIPFIHKTHPAYGKTPDQIYAYLMNKYLCIKPDIIQSINAFSHRLFSQNSAVLAVHMPGPFTADIYPQIQKYNQTNLFHPLVWNNYGKPKIGRNHYHRHGAMNRGDLFEVDDALHSHEVVRLLDVSAKSDPYQRYHPEIKTFLAKYCITKIYLITDRVEIVEEFKKQYGSMVEYNTYDRLVGNETKSHATLENHLNKRSKGVEALQDAYIAARCAFFIGYGFSYLSQGIAHLKPWPETNIKLHYWMYEKLYNFTYKKIQTGRYAPEEANGWGKIFISKRKNSFEKVKHVFW